jgi:hypothetical protein
LAWILARKNSGESCTPYTWTSQNTNRLGLKFRAVLTEDASDVKLALV